MDSKWLGQNIEIKQEHNITMIREWQPWKSWKEDIVVYIIDEDKSFQVKEMPIITL